jgi:hypothetical protein
MIGYQNFMMFFVASALKEAASIYIKLHGSKQ